MKQNQTRICAKCKTEKPVSEFSKQKGGRGGLRSICKDCNKQYRQDNKTQIKKYRQSNKIQMAEYSRRYYQVHKTEIAERTKKYQQINKIRKSEYSKEYRQTRKLEIAEYRQAHKTETAAYNKKYYQTDAGKISVKKNRHKRRALKYGNIYEVFDSKEIFERDRYRCQNCGKKTRPDFKDPFHSLYPNLDHIVPLSKGGAHTRLNTQCLCRQCNIEKGSTGIGDQLRMFG